MIKILLLFLLPILPIQGDRKPPSLTPSPRFGKYEMYNEKTGFTTTISLYWNRTYILENRMGWEFDNKWDGKWRPYGQDTLLLANDAEDYHHPFAAVRMPDEDKKIMIMGTDTLRRVSQ